MNEKDLGQIIKKKGKIQVSCQEKNKFIPRFLITVAVLTVISLFYLEIDWLKLLSRIPNAVSDKEALLAGDVLATGYWAADISEVSEQDTVVIFGGGPTGICTLLCVMLKHPKRIIMCEVDAARLTFINKHYPELSLIHI